MINEPDILFAHTHLYIEFFNNLTEIVFIE